jgi:hypothetical protein
MMWNEVASQHASWLVGQERLDHAPLEVGQIISAHADAESDLGTTLKTLVLIRREDRR